MKFKNHVKRLTAIITLLLVMAACSSRPEVKEFSKSADAKQEITHLNLAFEESSRNNSEYDLLAPVSYKKTKDALQDAKQILKEDKNNDKALKKVALGNAYFEEARKNAEENKEKLRDILVARDAAKAANANIILNKDFRKLDGQIKEQTAKLEKNKDDEIKEKRSDLITGYLDLELKAIKKTHLGESKFLIDESIKNGARDLAPKTLASANEKYAEADLFITQNRHNTEEIGLYTAAVLSEARKLEATTASARGLSASSPEEVALRMNAEEERLRKTQMALNEEQDTAAALAASNTVMSEEQKLNEIYEEARKKFSPEEAEVYKQGKNLVIRLRALEFPKSQAVLKGENFALLRKVEDVIQSFDQSKVIVEGHTDSTGSKSLNQKLSDERAEAVKQYLEANSSNPGTEFESEGFGYEKPLASNKTPEGRAQNRRVDVIVTPTQI